MALIVFGSQKGSPGASLTALAVAAAWPKRDGRKVVLLEADPDGGVLAVRYGLGREPGLLTLAASGRHGTNRDGLWSHTQQLPGGLPVVVAPDRPGQASAALHTAGDTLGRWLQSLTDVDVVADVGRLSPYSPALSFTSAADMIMMVARPDAEQIQPAAERIKALRAMNESTGWCLIGTKPHTPAEIAEVHRIPVFGEIAHDTRGAHALERGGSPSRVRRSALVRSAADLASSIEGWLHPVIPSTAPPPSDVVDPDGARRRDAEIWGAEDIENPAGGSEVSASDGRAEQVVDTDDFNDAEPHRADLARIDPTGGRA